MPPAHILNAPTKLMKDIGYGKGYAYDHDADEGFSGAGLLARGDGARRPSTSRPTAASRPRSRERLDYWDERRKELQQSAGDDGLNAHG